MANVCPRCGEEVKSSKNAKTMHPRICSRRIDEKLAAVLNLPFVELAIAAAGERGTVTVCRQGASFVVEAGDTSTEFLNAGMAAACFNMFLAAEETDPMMAGMQRAWLAEHAVKKSA